MQIDDDAGTPAGFAVRVLIAIGLLALAALAWRLADIWVVVFGGIILAATLRALTNLVMRHTPVPNRIALPVVVLALVALLSLGGWLIGEQVATQLQTLTKLLPDAIARTRAWLQQTPLGSTLMNYLQSSASDSSGDTISSVARFASTTFGAVANLIVILFLGLYLAADPQLYRNGTLRLIPQSGRERAGRALDAAGVALRKWLGGQLSAMVVVGLLTFAALKLLHMPLALSLALIAGLLEFIPFVGPILSGVPAVLVAFTVSPTEAMYVAIAYLVIHQIEGNVVMPIVQKLAVELPPALGIASLVTFGLLFGVPGILLAVPLMVVAIALVKVLYIEGALADTGGKSVRRIEPATTRRGR
jgi:predicted PurR-regulated permease PerM